MALPEKPYFTTSSISGSYLFLSWIQYWSTGNNSSYSYSIYMARTKSEEPVLYRNPGYTYYDQIQIELLGNYYFYLAARNAEGQSELSDPILIKDGEIVDYIDDDDEPQTNEPTVLTYRIERLGVGATPTLKLVASSKIAATHFRCYKKDIRTGEFHFVGEQTGSGHGNENSLTFPLSSLRGRQIFRITTRNGDTESHPSEEFEIRIQHTSITPSVPVEGGYYQPTNRDEFIELIILNVTNIRLADNIVISNLTEEELDYEGNVIWDTMLGIDPFLDAGSNEPALGGNIEGNGFQLAIYPPENKTLPLRETLNALDLYVNPKINAEVEPTERRTIKLRGLHCKNILNSTVTLDLEGEIKVTGENNYVWNSIIEVVGYDVEQVTDTDLFYITDLDVKDETSNLSHRVQLDFLGVNGVIDVNASNYDLHKGLKNSKAMVDFKITADDSVYTGMDININSSVILQDSELTYSTKLLKRNKNTILPEGNINIRVVPTLELPSSGYGVYAPIQNSNVLVNFNNDVPANYIFKSYEGVGYIGEVNTHNYNTDNPITYQFTGRKLASYIDFNVYPQREEPVNVEFMLGSERRMTSVEGWEWNLHDSYLHGKTNFNTTHKLLVRGKRVYVNLRKQNTDIQDYLPEQPTLYDAMHIHEISTSAGRAYDFDVGDLYTFYNEDRWVTKTKELSRKALLTGELRKKESFETQTYYGVSQDFIEPYDMYLVYKGLDPEEGFVYADIEDNFKVGDTVFFYDLVDQETATYNITVCRLTFYHGVTEKLGIHPMHEWNYETLGSYHHSYYTGEKKIKGYISNSDDIFQFPYVHPILDIEVATYGEVKLHIVTGYVHEDAYLKILGVVNLGARYVSVSESDPRVWGGPQAKGEICYRLRGKHPEEGLDVEIIELTETDEVPYLGGYRWEYRTLGVINLPHEWSGLTTGRESLRYSITNQGQNTIYSFSDKYERLDAIDTYLYGNITLHFTYGAEDPYTEDNPLNEGFDFETVWNIHETFHDGMPFLRVIDLEALFLLRPDLQPPDYEDDETGEVEILYFTTGIKYKTSRGEMVTVGVEPSSPLSSPLRVQTSKGVISLLLADPDSGEGYDKSYRISTSQGVKVLIAITPDEVYSEPIITLPDGKEYKLIHL